MGIASQYVRGAKVPAEARVYVAEAMSEHVTVTVPAVLPPTISGITTLTAGFPNPSIRESVEVSHTPTASESITESVVVTAT